MKSFRAVFHIVEDNNCPLYELEDEFVLTEKSLAFPDGKESCLILVREVTQILFQLLGKVDNPDYKTRYTCSGCTGLIKFQRVSRDEGNGEGPTESLLGEKELKLFDKIRGYSLFKAIPANHLKKFISSFKGRVIKKNEILIRKGELNEHLFIILAGEVIVEDGSVPITRLGEGELCGEMSYFGDNIASTSVRAVIDSRAIAISGKDFSELIKKSNAVQVHMARLLAERLSKANAVRARDFESCMQGRLNEMAPAELLQVFHMHQKTGVLNLDLPEGKAHVSFREGAIVAARYAGKDGQDAVFAVLAEREGVYKFTSGLSGQERDLAPVGDFMMLLMEGIKRVDEE